jgi:hypothetical protein
MGKGTYRSFRIDKDGKVLNICVGVTPENFWVANFEVRDRGQTYVSYAKRIPSPTRKIAFKKLRYEIALYLNPSIKKVSQRIRKPNLLSAFENVRASQDAYDAVAAYQKAFPNWNRKIK